MKSYWDKEEAALPYKIGHRFQRPEENKGGLTTEMGRGKCQKESNLSQAQWFGI